MNALTVNNKNIILAFIMVFCFTGAVIAQIKTADSTKVDSNIFLDLGAQTLSQVFGEDLDGNATGKTIGFLEMLNKSELPQNQKAEYKNLYYLHAKELTQKQKDSLGKAFEKKILEAKTTDD